MRKLHLLLSSPFALVMLLMLCVGLSVAQTTTTPTTDPTITAAAAAAAAATDPTVDITTATIAAITDSTTACQLTQTNIVLGFVPLSQTPIYKNTCSGTCLSVIAQPRDCYPVLQKISVAAQPNAPNSSVVTQVQSCQCESRRCNVTTNGQTLSYPHGAFVLDGCERKCTCDYGNLINCCRQRKEFRLGLTDAEKSRYLAAVYTVSTNTLYQAQYNSLIRKHATLFASIHGGPVFLPWHREYLWDLENLLRRVDCRITIPYWQWSLEASAPFASSLWSNNAFGIGGNGFGSCIPAGSRFARPWTTTESPARCLTRNFVTTATFATEVDVSQTLNSLCPLSSQYSCMSRRVEAMHNYVHSSTRGQMGGSASANDPLFFLHHCYIDRIWAKWQSKSSAHVSAYFGDVTTVHVGSTYTVADFLDLTKQQNNPNNQVCYIDPSNTWWIDSALLATPVNTLANLQSNGNNGNNGNRFNRGNNDDNNNDNNDNSSNNNSNNDNNNNNNNSNSNSGSNGKSSKLRKRNRESDDDKYQPFASGCSTASRLQQIPRIPLQPFPAEFLANMNMSDADIRELRAFHDYRNGASFNLIPVASLSDSKNPFAPLGFYLYQNDFRCFVDDDTRLVNNYYDQSRERDNN